MRGNQRRGLLVSAFALVLGAGCGDSGWSPVAGKDASSPWQKSQEGAGFREPDVV